MKRLGHRQGAGWILALSIGLLFAFWPTLVDLFEHGGAHPWARAGLVFPWLTWIVWRSEQKPVEAARWAAPVVALGLIIELAGIAGNLVRLGRAGLALAAFGLCRGSGSTSSGLALLLLWTLPAPHFVIAAASPALESSWAAIAAGAAQSAGLSVDSIHGGLRTPSSSLRLLPLDGGIALAILMAGLGWFHGLRSARTIGTRLLHSLLFAILGFPIQMVAIGMTGILLARGSDPSSLRQGLDVFPWLWIWGVAFYIVWRTRPAPGFQEPGPQENA